MTTTRNVIAAIAAAFRMGMNHGKAQADRRLGPVLDDIRARAVGGGASAPGGLESGTAAAELKALPPRESGEVLPRLLLLLAIAAACAVAWAPNMPAFPLLSLFAESADDEEMAHTDE